MQIKIGILGTRGIPNAYGGFEQFAQYLAAGLVKKGHSVTVYNSSTHPFQDSNWAGIEIVHCYDPENKIGTAGQFIYDYNCIRDAAKRNFDIILHLGYTSSSVWHRYWPENVINIINMDGLEWKRTKYNKLTRRFLKWAESLAANHADILIADSIGIRDHLHRTYQKQSIYIPYGADIPTNFSDSVLSEYQLKKHEYYLLIARMESENNIETIIRGYLESGQTIPLVLVGSTKNNYGNYLSKKYISDSIKFIGATYDPDTINSLRHFSTLYFHGHSVGGTNPSLLEAMACGCTIAAHDNEFNRAILGYEAYYFSNPHDIKIIIDQSSDQNTIRFHSASNIEKVKKEYNWEFIVQEYEQVFLKGLQEKTK